MTSNRGGAAMAAMADNSPRDTQDTRNAKARVKIRCKLRRRGEVGPIAHLPVGQLIELMRESKPEPRYQEQIRAAARSRPGVWVEVDEAYYEFCFNSLPPVEYAYRGYVMGAAQTHDDDGTPYFFAFIWVWGNQDNRRYFARVCTVKQWKTTTYTATLETLTTNPESAQPCI